LYKIGVLEAEKQHNWLKNELLYKFFMYRKALSLFFFLIRKVIVSGKNDEE